MLTAAGLAASPLIVRAFTAAEPNGQIRADKNALGTFFALVFIPQVFCYGVVIVSSAVLAARHKFLAAAISPAVNNVVVIGVYVVFWAMRHGRPPSLHLSAVEFGVLAGGTTLAVVAFAAVPVWLAVRGGLMGRPNFDRTLAAQAGLHRAGSWAVLQMAGLLSLNFVAIALGNGAENGTGVFLWAQNFMLLPIGLVAAPIATSMAPRLVSARTSNDAEAGRRHSEGALLATTVGLTAASALLVGLGWPVARLLAFGEATRNGFAPLAHTLVAFGALLVLPGLVWVLTRMLFSIDDARGAALTNVVLAVAGAVVMGIAADVTLRSDRAPALAAGFGAAHLVGVVVMAVRYRRRSGWLGLRSWARPALASIFAGAAAAIAVLELADRFPTSRVGALGAIVVGTPVGLFVFGLLTRVLGGRSLRLRVNWDR
jgi:putative peptidoglycan lipid II flippase